MATSLSRLKKNRKLYPNQLEVFTEPSTGISKTNKSSLWVESKEIDWSPRSKKQSSLKKEDLPAQSVTLSTVEVDEEETENDESGVSYEPPGPSLDESDEGESEESPADDYVIIGFDTEYVSRKLRRLKTVAEDGVVQIHPGHPPQDAPEGSPSRAADRCHCNAAPR
jgi:hypothetical protein